MIAHRVEQSGARLNLNVSRGSVHVKSDLDVSRERRWLFFLCFCVRPEVVGNGSAGAGDAYTLQKLTPAWIVAIMIITRLGHCFSPALVILVKPLSA